MNTLTSIAGIKLLTCRQSSGQRSVAGCHLPDCTFAHPPLRPPARFFADNLESPSTSSQQVACVCVAFHSLTGWTAWEMNFPTSLQMGVAHDSPPKRLPPHAALLMRAVEWWCLITANGCQLSACRASRSLPIARFPSVDISATHRDLSRHIRSRGCRARCCST